MVALDLSLESDSTVCQYFKHTPHSIYSDSELLIKELQRRGVSREDCIRLTGSAGVYWPDGDTPKGGFLEGVVKRGGAPNFSNNNIGNAAPKTRTSVAPKPRTVIDDCMLDYHCDFGMKCVKPKLDYTGTCMKTVDQFGNQTYSKQSPKIEMQSRTSCNKINGRACGVGFRCDDTYNVCVRD